VTPAWVVIVWAVLMGAVGLLSYRFGYRGAQRLDQQRPICGCSHHLSFHERSGRCRWDHFNRMHCTCQRYIGPEPVPTFLWPHVDKEAEL